MTDDETPTVPVVDDAAETAADPPVPVVDEVAPEPEPEPEHDSEGCIHCQRIGELTGTVNEISNKLATQEDPRTDESLVDESPVKLPWTHRTPFSKSE